MNIKFILVFLVQLEIEPTTNASNLNVAFAKPTESLLFDVVYTKDNRILEEYHELPASASKIRGNRKCFQRLTRRIHFPEADFSSLTRNNSTRFMETSLSVTSMIKSITSPTRTYKRKYTKLHKQNRKLMQIAPLFQSVNNKIFGY